MLARRLTLRRAAALTVAAAITLGVDRYSSRPPVSTTPEPGIQLAVATRDLAIDEPIADDMVRFVTVDPDLGLAGAGLRPSGRRLSRPVAAGEIVGEDDVAARDPSGLRAGERAVAIASATLHLEPGDEVELVGVAAGEDGSVRSEVLGPVVSVLSVHDDSVVVAVPAALAPELIRRQAVGAVELIRTPGNP